MRLSVIIPSKNPDNLRPCVAAVRKHEPAAEIIVVDDGLGAETREQVQARYVDGAKPFVYARNINFGIKEAYRHFVGFDDIGDPNPDGVVLLNDDAILEIPGGFSVMAEAQSAHPEYGLIGATTKVTGNPNQFPKGIGLRDEPRMVTFVAVYISRSTLQRVGALDERYVGYGIDDDDYCWRVRTMGLKIGVHDGCYVDHGSLKSTFRGDPKTPADFKPNLKLFIQKWGHDNWGNRV